MSDSNSRKQVSQIIQLEFDIEVPIKQGPVILSSINQAVLRGQTPTHGGFHYQSNNLVMSFVRYLYNWCREESVFLLITFARNGYYIRYDIIITVWLSQTMYLKFIKFQVASCFWRGW